MNRNRQVPKALLSASRLARGVFHWRMTVLVTLCLAVFAGQLGHDLSNWDDNWLITENRWIRDLNASSLSAILNPWAPMDVREELGAEYLPVRDLSYALDYALWGYRPVGFLLSNLLLHLACVLMVWALARKVIAHRNAAWFAALLFALMPIHVEVVSWASSRKDLLATAFALASLLLYLRHRHGNRVAPWLASLACFIAAILSKVPAIALPGLLVGAEVFMRQRLHPLTWTKVALRLLPFVAIALAHFFFIALPIADHGLVREPFGGERMASSFTSLAALFDAIAGMLVAGAGGPAVDYPLRTGLSPGAVVVLALAVMTGIAAIRAMTAASRRVPGTSLFAGPEWFGWWCMLVAFVPVSNLIVITGTVYADRYAYLPSVGWCLALAAIGLALANAVRGRWLRGVVWVAAMALLAFNALHTVAAVRNWQDSEVLWRAVLARDAHNHTALFNLARTLQERGNAEPDPGVRKARLIEAKGWYEQALRDPARTFRSDPARVLVALATLELHLENPQQCLVRLEQAASQLELPWRKPQSRDFQIMQAIIANTRGLALFALGDETGAEAAFVQATSYGRFSPGAWLNLAEQTMRRAKRELPTPPSPASASNQATRLAAMRDAAQQTETLIARYESIRRGPDATSHATRAKIALELATAIEGEDAETPPPEAIALYRDAARSFGLAVQMLEAELPHRETELYSHLLYQAEALQRVPEDAPAAIDLLARATLLAPAHYDPTPRLLRSRLLLRTGKSLQGIDALSELLRLFPKFQPARDELAAIHATKAAQAWSLVREQRLAELQERERGKAEPSGENPADDAIMAAFMGEQAFVLELANIRVSYEKAFELAGAGNPSAQAGARFLFSLGKALLAFGDLAGGEETLRRGYQFDPDYEPTSALLGGLYFRMLEDLAPRARDALALSDPALARERYEEMWRLSLNMAALSPMAAKTLAHRLVRLANARQLRINEESVKDTGERARLMSEVIELYKMAATLDPEQAEALSQLKDYYKESGRYSEAVETFRRLARVLQPEPVKLRQLRLALAATLMEWGQQLSLEYRTLTRTSERERALGLRSQCISVFRDAVDEYRAALELSPLTPPLHLVQGLGAAYQKLAVLELAQAPYWLERALEAYQLRPDDFTAERAAVHGKRALFLVNQPQQRLEALQAALALASDDATRAQLQEHIAELERETLKRDATMALERKDYQQVIDIIDRSAATDQSWLALRAGALEGLGRTREAAQAYALCTGSTQAQVRAGELYLACGDDDLLDEAGVNFRAARVRLVMEMRAAGGDAAGLATLQAQLARVTDGLAKVDQHSAALVEQARLSTSFTRTERLLERALEIAPENYEASAALARGCVDWARALVKAANQQHQEGKTELAAATTVEARAFYRRAWNAWRDAFLSDSPFALRYVAEACGLVLDEELALYLPARRDEGIELCERALMAFEAMLADAAERHHNADMLAPQRSRLSRLQAQLAAVREEGAAHEEGPRHGR